MGIVIVYITCNRLGYSQLSLPRLLEDPTEEFELVIWDNGSTDGTVEYLKQVRDPRIREVVFRPANEGQGPAINYAWNTNSVDLCGKVDNDCLVTPGWTRILSAAHRDIRDFGVVGCWHFLPEDFDLKIAHHKIRRYGRHQVVVHPYMDGSGFLVKRVDYDAHGPVPANGALTRYWINLARVGRVNGWYYPLVLQEHMDDPRSPRCLLPEHFEGELPFALRFRGFTSRREFGTWLKNDARRILRSSSDVKHYVGWRAALRGFRRRVGRRVGRLVRAARTITRGTVA